jgi:hypothetical protein
MALYFGKTKACNGSGNQSEWKTYFDNGGKLWAYYDYKAKITTLAPYLDFSDTADVTDFSHMFANNTALTTIPKLDMRKGTNFADMLTGDTAITSFGGYGIAYSFDLSMATKMEEGEIAKVLRNLATITDTQTLTLGATNLAKLTDAEKAIATSKGWTLA